MLGPKSLRMRLLGILWGVLALCVVWPCWWMYEDVREKVFSEAKVRAIEDLNLVDRLMKMHGVFDDLDDAQSWIAAVAEAKGSRITYVNDAGKVIVDSLFSLEEIQKLGEFGTRPEILQAKRGEIGVTIRLSTLTQKDYIFVAKQAEGLGVLPPGILRLAVPFWQTNRALEALHRGLTLAAVLAFLGMVPAVLLWRRELRKVLNRFVEATERIFRSDKKDPLSFPDDSELEPLADAFNGMVREIERRFAVLREEKEQLEAVFEGMQEGVMVLDSRGRIRRTNRSLSTIATRAPITVGRQPMEVLMNYEIQETCERLLAEANGESPKRVNLQVELERERTYDVNIVKLQESGKEPVLVVVFHNISELKRLEKVRQDFVANVSHELRTPLTSVKGYTETLLADPLFQKEPTATFLQTILRNTNHMVMIVDDLLKLARLEARNQRIESSPVDAAAALAEAWKSCEAMAEPKRVRLDSRLPPEGIYVQADRDRLVQVFRNLIENAVKYSPEDDAITVFCEEGASTFTFGVQDNGIGIPSHHQQRIFERFYRIERHRDRESGSTGLGLAICRHIVLNFGGQLWLQSPNPGSLKGSTFYFSLPKANAKPTVEKSVERGVDEEPVLEG